MTYACFLAPFLITVVIFVRSMFFGPDFIIVGNKPNIIPDALDIELSQLSFNPDLSVTFKNGTITNEKFFIKRATIPREFEGKDFTQKPRGLMIEIQGDKDDPTAIEDSWEGIVPAMKTIQAEDQTDSGFYQCKVLDDPYYYNIHRTLGILRQVGCVIDATKKIAYMDGITYIEVDP